MLVVTGASGLLGANLLSVAPNRGYQAVGLCNAHHIHIPGLSVFAQDLTDFDATRQMLLRLAPTAIVHCAAATNVDWCQDHPAETDRINIQVPSALAAIAAEFHVKFVHISTDSVFGGSKSFSVETDECGPLNAYASSKLQAEREVQRQNPQALVIRTNIYGWNAQRKQSLAEWIIGQLEEGKHVPGFVDVYFTPILTNDLADILLDMLNLDLVGIYHVAGAQRISKYDFARRTAAIFGFEPERIRPARLAEADLKALRPLDTSLNTGKAQSAVSRRIPDVDTGRNGSPPCGRADTHNNSKAFSAEYCHDQS